MKIQCVDYYESTSPELFTQSLKETGFGIVKNHPVDQQLIDEVFQQWFEFFKSNEAEKEKYLFDRVKHDGFVPMSLSETAKGYDVKDIKEFYHYYPSGRCPNHLRKITQELYTQMATMAETLLQWVEDNTPPTIAKNFSMPLREMIKDSNRTLFRLIHYPPLTGPIEKGAIRAAAHEDINLLTLLPAATAEGLQVQDAQGNWHDVDCDKARIIVNIGDMLSECTDDYFKATTHRVANPEGEKAHQSRLSMPLFLHPRDEVRLSARHTAKSYCDERYAELGLA